MLSTLIDPCNHTRPIHQMNGHASQLEHLSKSQVTQRQVSSKSQVFRGKSQVNTSKLQDQIPQTQVPISANYFHGGR